MRISDDLNSNKVWYENELISLFNATRRIAANAGIDPITTSARHFWTFNGIRLKYLPNKLVNIKSKSAKRSWSDYNISVAAIVWLRKIFIQGKI